MHEAAIHRHGISGGAEERHRIISRVVHGRHLVVCLAVGRVVRRSRRVRLEGPRPRVAVVWEHVRRARFQRNVLEEYPERCSGRLRIPRNISVRRLLSRAGERDHARELDEGRLVV